MRILHYSLGLPPYRSGGLTKYSNDLMIQQVKDGNTVFLFHPGFSRFLKRSKSAIKMEQKYNGIFVYALQNPPPLPLLYGIKSPIDILKKSESVKEDQIIRFYKEVKPEVFHIHTLMGLPLDVVKYFKAKGVKIVYTSHDYFGLCMRTSFIDSKGSPCVSNEAMRCARCNFHCPSSTFLELRNFKFLLKFKNEFGLLRQSISIFHNKDEIKNFFVGDVSIYYYQKLINYYQEFYGLIDVFHFNSQVAREVYASFIAPSKLVVVPITHSGISDHRTKKVIRNNLVKIGFIGSLLDYKGFPLLRKVLLKLNAQGVDNWQLDIWGNLKIGSDGVCEKMNYHGKYTSAHLKSVFDEISILIVPSICKETFSLITLEALSYGTPVLVSKNVGAKDIVSEYDTEFIFEANYDCLYKKLKSILSNPELITNFNNKLLTRNFSHSIEEHSLRMAEIYCSI